MTTELIAFAAVLLGPVIVALGFLGVVALMVAGASDVVDLDPGDGLFLRRPSADPQP